jgi:hypothetical protein
MNNSAHDDMGNYIPFVKKTDAKFKIMKKENANFGQLSQKSWLRGLYYTILTAVLPMVITLLNTGDLTLQQLKPIGLAALSVGVTYILTHLVTNSKDEMFTKEPGDKNNND